MPSRLALAVLAASPLCAETYVLTLREAVDLALRQNHDVALARLDEQRAAQVAREVADPFSLRAYLGSGLAYSNGFPQSIDGAAPSILQARAFYSLFNRPLQFRVSEARENARGSAIDTALRRDEVAFRAAALFQDVQRTEAARLLAAEQTDTFQRTLALIEVRVREGVALPLERARVQLNVARARQRAVALEGDRNFLQSSLAVAVGYTPDDRVQPRAGTPAPLVIPATEEEAIRAAQANSKELRRLESSLLARRFAVRSAESAWLPQFDLVAQYGLFAKFNNYEEFFQRFQRHNAQIGASITLPVLPGSAATAQRAQAQIDISRLQTQINSVRNRITLDLRRAYQDLRTAQAALEVADLDADVSRSQSAVLAAQAEEGRAALGQLQEARGAEAERALARLDAEGLVQRARLNVLRLTGTIQDSLP